MKTGVAYHDVRDFRHVREVMRAAELFYEEGVRNIAAWSYRGVGWMYTRSEDADKVWENLGKVFAKLHR